MNIAARNDGLKRASGEELLVLAVLRGHKLKPRIDRELDRRAHLRKSNQRLSAHGEHAA